MSVKPSRNARPPSDPYGDVSPIEKPALASLGVRTPPLPKPNDKKNRRETESNIKGLEAVRMSQESGQCGHDEHRETGYDQHWHS